MLTASDRALQLALLVLVVPYAILCWVVAPCFLLFAAIITLGAALLDRCGFEEFSGMFIVTLFVVTSPFRFVFDRIYAAVLGREHEWKFH
jgi:hypothetical protein